MGRIRRNSLLILVGFVLFLLVVCPIVMIFARAVVVDGRLDFSAALQSIANQENVQTIVNSLLLGIAVVIGVTVIAAPIAYLTARTQIGSYQWLDIVLMIPFMIPPFITSMGWILFMQKRGLLQQLFPATGSWSEGFFSFGGLVLVMSFHIYPFMMTILKSAMLNINSSLEESGAVFGGGPFYRMRRIFIPLLVGNYAIGALLVFVKTLSEYGTPATLGRRIGYYVFTTNIHRYATTSPINFGRAASLSSVLITICLLMWLLQNTITNRNSYRLVSGKGSRNKIIHLTGFRLILAWAVILLVILLAIGIPLFSIISTSLIKLRGYGLAPGNFTFEHYVNLFTENPKGRNALLVSLTLAVSAATLASVLGTLIVTVIRSKPGRAGKLVEAVSLVPEMLPSIVLIIGIMLFWNGIYKILPLYNTIWIMIIAYVALFTPFSIQYVTSAYTQINDSLMQAGRTFGGSPLYVFRRITFPLISKGILFGWMMIFIISFRELVTASLIAPPNTLVISTFIVREFEQGSVSIGMAMAVICILFTTTALILLNQMIQRQQK